MFYIYSIPLNHPILTAFLAVLNPIAFKFSWANPLWSSPFQRDGGIADVIHTQASGLAGRSCGQEVDTNEYVFQSKETMFLYKGLAKYHFLCTGSWSKSIMYHLTLLFVFQLSL